MPTTAGVKQSKLLTHTVAVVLLFEGIISAAHTNGILYFSIVVPAMKYPARRASYEFAKMIRN